MSAKIPQPRGLPLLGNIRTIDPDLPIISLYNLHLRYGEIYSLTLLGEEKIFVGSQRIVHEISDQTRFKKVVKGGLKEVRALAGDGLFTAYPDEENWAIAHRILTPAFGPLSIRAMLPGMIDIASQLMLKWERFGDGPIDVVGDFTKLALDSIALCTFSYRFNSFYSAEPPEFVNAMIRCLLGAGARTRRLPLGPVGRPLLYGNADRGMKDDIAYQHEVAEQIIKERVENPVETKDLLNLMLNGTDPVTGKKLSHENIRNQLVTFLIAGHETTSGMLSFLFHYLLVTPRAYQAIRREVDEVCGGDDIELQHLSKLKYVDASLKEALRLQPTAPAWTVAPVKDEVICDGKYKIKGGAAISVMLHALHRDPAVWGDDVEEFRPERMLDGKFEALPPDSWKPFGNGARACIGRPFAWQEALLAVAMIFQRFDIRPHDINYKLEVKATLTIKPHGLYMHVTPRHDRKLGNQSPSIATASPVQASKLEDEEAVAAPPDGLLPMYIFYGSNSGTCEAFAHKLLDSAASHGCKATMSTLNQLANGKFPTKGPVIVVTASYEGRPTDDAAHFVEWLKGASQGAASNVNYAVFGCGHTDWASTYQSIPKLIDEKLAACRGERICERGIGNAAGADIFGDFEDWCETLWLSLAIRNTSLSAAASQTDVPTLEISINTKYRPEQLRYGFMESGTVVSNTVITKGDCEIKRHIEITLPEGTVYRAGDYLGILPVSPISLVQRALIVFGLHSDDILTIKSKTPQSIPIDRPVSAFVLFCGFLELDQPATLRNVKLLLERCQDQDIKKSLERYTEPETYIDEIWGRKISLLALLEKYPSIKFPLVDFLDAVPVIRMRQYSISSSPLYKPNQVSLTVGVLDAPHQSGKGRYLGTASNFLAQLIPGLKLRAAIRPSGEGFHPPADPRVPMIMIAAGTGMAPFRAFVQERALQKQAGRTVGPCLLFYGCRSPESDLLYDDEMRQWEHEGVVSIRHAFSRVPDQSEGCKHVQDRLWHDRVDAEHFFINHARIYICGASRLAEAVRDTCVKIYKDTMGCGDDEADEWLHQVQGDRFATDVFG